MVGMWWVCSGYVGRYVGRYVLIYESMYLCIYMHACMYVRCKPQMDMVYNHHYKWSSWVWLCLDR